MRNDTTTYKPSLIRRILGSAGFKTAVFLLLFVLVSSLLTMGADSKVREKQLEFLEEAVQRSAVQCYALEGRFPDNLSYLEDNYGLIIDHRNYVVHYETRGDNLLPQIRIIPLDY